MTIEEKAKEYISNICSLPLISTVRAVLNTTAICQIDDMKLEDMYKFGMIEGFISGMKEATCWIPVEESLPEDHPYLIMPNDNSVYVQSNKVLVKYENGITSTDHRFRFSSIKSFKWSSGGNIVAWRPIEFE